MLKKGVSVSDEDLKSMSDEIVANVNRATKVIQHVRDFARQSEVVRNRLNINDPIKDVFKIMGNQIKVHEIELTRRLIEAVETIPGLRIVGQGTGSMETRSSVVAIHSDRISPSDLADRLAERKIAVGSGHFYAVRLLEALGIDPERGVLRVSMVHYNSMEEVDRLTSALREILTQAT